MKQQPFVVMRRPVREAAEQYRAEVKPVLAAIAKRLGYTVGSYSGHGSPHTVLRCTDAASPVDCLLLYWRGAELEVGVRSRQWRQDMQTEMGQLAHAMSWGVHEAYGTSNAPELAARIEQAIAAALRAFSKGKQR